MEDIKSICSVYYVINAVLQYFQLLQLYLISLFIISYLGSNIIYNELEYLNYINI